MNQKDFKNLNFLKMEKKLLFSNYLKMQLIFLYKSDMHRCAASCCDNQSYTIQKLHSCIENCGTPLSKAQQYIQEEFDRVQVKKLHI